MCYIFRVIFWKVFKMKGYRLKRKSLWSLSNVKKAASVKWKCASFTAEINCQKGRYYHLHCGKLETSANTVWGGRVVKHLPNGRQGKFKVKGWWASQSAHGVNQQSFLMRMHQRNKMKKHHCSGSESERGYKKKSFQNVYKTPGKVKPSGVLQARRHWFVLIFLWICLSIVSHGGGCPLFLEWQHWFLSSAEEVLKNLSVNEKLYMSPCCHKFFSY